MVFFPLAEVFGFRPDDVSPEAIDARKRSWCPSRDMACSKPGTAGRLGACSLSVSQGEKTTTEVLCPSRFLEKNVVFQELAKFLLPGSQETTFVPEVRVRSQSRNEVQGPALGNVDWTAASIVDGEIVAYGTAEFQGVYSSGGGIQEAFDAYMKNPEPRTVPKVSVSPTPDFRSSGRKRLVPQLRAKGAAFASGSTRQAVVLTEGLFQEEFAKSLRSRVDPAESNLMFLLVRITPGTRGLEVVDRVYTRYVTAMAELDDAPLPDLSAFERALQAKVEKSHGTKVITSLPLPVE